MNSTAPAMPGQAAVARANNTGARYRRMVLSFIRLAASALTIRPGLRPQPRHGIGLAATIAR